MPIVKIKSSEEILIQIDEEDIHFIGHWTWRLNCGYVSRNQKNKTLFLHRQIMDAQKGQMLDHINCDKLNLKKSNLRFCNKSQNSMNRVKPKTNSPFKYKGVTLDNRRNPPFRAVISKDGKQKHIGYFKTEEIAAVAYNKAAREMFGEFARFNVIYY